MHGVATEINRRGAQPPCPCARMLFRDRFQLPLGLEVGKLRASWCVNQKVGMLWGGLFFPVKWKIG